MNIIIIGASDVGIQIAEKLSLEDHNVFLIDKDKNILEQLKKKNNVLTLFGHVGNINVLEKADIQNCDVLIAATNTDETNMIACLTAKKFKVKLKIARIRNYFPKFDIIHKKIKNNKNNFLKFDSLLTINELGIDFLINPEEVVAEQIIDLLHSPEAFEIVKFEEEHLQIKGFKITSGLKIANTLIKDFAQYTDLSHILILAIIRDGKMIIPKGPRELIVGDKVYLIGENRNLRKIAPYFHEKYKPIKYVFVIGVSNISRYLCYHFQNESIRVKLLESNKEKASRFAEEYQDIDVIHCNPTDLDVLLDEGLENIDAFIAVSGDEEKNLLSSMLAKKHKVPKTFAKLQNDDYLPFTTAMGIDTIVNPKESAVSKVLKYVRKGNILSVDILGEKNAEATSYEIRDKFSFLGKPIKSIKMPEESLIAAIIRNNKPIIPKGHNIIKSKDKVITFYHKTVVEEISKLFG